MDGTLTPGSGTMVTVSTNGGMREEVPGVRPGEVVGRHVVERTLGSGGMGFVVLARDPKLDRRVAIKVLYREDAKGEVWLRREAQALAALTHPGIVAIHDVGVLDGRPFIAMEFVEGVTLRTWLDETKRSTSELLEVFVAAGRALAAVHEQGIVHCDVKPGNIMIRSGAGSTTSLADSVCIMDFGLARLHGEGGAQTGEAAPPVSVEVSESLLSQDFTDFDKLQGTPKYMAPEQFAKLEVTPAADQYALSIALYEALWERSPFKGESFSARAAEQMCGAQPIRPLTARDRKRFVDPVLRGLNPVPSERWPTLTQLCDALQPTSRRKWWAGGIGVATAVGVAGWFAVADREERCTQIESRAGAAWNEAVRADIRQAFAATGRSYASEAWARSEANLDAWISNWVSVAREDCLATFERAEVSEHDYDLHAHCFTRQRQRFEAVTETLRSVDVGNVVRALDTVAALPEPEGCLGDEVLDRPSDPKRAALVDALYEDIDRCDVIGAAGRPEDYEACARETLDAATQAGHEHAMLDARKALAQAVFSGGRRNESRELFESLYFDAIAAGRERLASSAALSVAFRYTGSRGDAEQARKWLRHAEPIRDTRAGDARFLRVKALYAHHGGLPELAVESARAAVATAEQTSNQDLLASTLNTLGKILNEGGHRDDARVVYERSLKVRRASRGRVHPLVATSLNNLATVLGDSGEHDEALAMLEEALAIRREMLPHEHRHIATGAANVAETLARMGKHDRALVLHRESAEVFAAVEGVESPYHAMLQTDVARDLRLLGRYDEAREALNIALPIWRRRPLGNHDRFNAEMELALLDEADGDHQAALEFFEAAAEAPLHKTDLAVVRANLERLRR